MKRFFWVIIAGIWGMARVSPVWAAPTDPTQSGTMDISHDHDDTNADLNEQKGRAAPMDTTTKSESELDHPGTRHSPKVDPTDPANSPQVVIPTAPVNLNTPPDATVGSITTSSAPAHSQ